MDAVTTIHLEEAGESCTDNEAATEAPDLAPLLSPTLAPGFVGSGSVSCRVSQRTLLETVGEDWVEEEIDVDQEQDFRDAGRCNELITISVRLMCLYCPVTVKKKYCLSAS